jgi:hypothetical protein
MKSAIPFLSVLTRAAVAVIAMTLACSPARTTHSTFGIYLVDTGELVLSDQDMAAYVRATHEIKLNESGIAKWNSQIQCSRLPGGLYQKDFAVRIDGKEIYRGTFWSGYSSQSHAGVVLDIAFRLDSTHNTIQIRYGYPVPLRGDKDDPRNNPEIFEFFAKKGLLK